VTTDILEKIRHLQGPVLVLGASGFVGANLFRMIAAGRADVFGTTMHVPAWRLEGFPEKQILTVDLLVDANLDALLNEIRPQTIFNCVAYGAYSFETDAELIYQTNFNFLAKLLPRLAARKVAACIHAGSSSEYGDRAAGPDEGDLPTPNSDYAVSKAACAHLLHYWGQKKGLPCANLRLYSVYGPLEDSSRLIPAVVQRGHHGTFPDFVHPDISRDFVYVDDACEAFLDAATRLTADQYGDSFNIGSGHKMTIAEVAAIAAELFTIDAPPVYNSMPSRAWDLRDWFAKPDKARDRLGWRARTAFRDGLARTSEWYRDLPDKERYHRASKQFGLDTKHSISAIVACYQDNQAIPVMYERLRATLTALKIDYEIIFVNDNSPDESEETIRALSRRDRRVTGISHSRNFGSQAAFRSGMEIAQKNACVLLDGDLQDPPELIAEFVARWRQGYDVVYGCRTKREAPLFMQLAYKAFYRIFDYFSYVRIPRDAGDFSLIDRRVAQWILRFPERDFFLRGIRAFAGFKQVGVDYVRPERMFGVSTNSLWKNIGWAKKGILSFSNTPLNILSFLGSVLLILSVALGALQVVSRLLLPQWAPKGVTTLLLAILFFGSVNLFAVGLLGEYIAKIFEEVKQRPHFIRRSIIKDGEIRSATDASAGTLR
jgi:nucleoside-diphosphate-sugar epimerase/glycosyltransferase involved in cell wall biosynthesis